MNVLQKERFLPIIASLTGLSPGATIWANDPNPMIGDQDRAQVQMSVFGIEVVGVDEHRNYFSAPDQPVGSYETVEIGNRHITINIRVEAYDFSVEASEILDRIRTGIRAAAVTAQLDNAWLAYVWSEKTTNLPTVYDSRVVSVCCADFLFAGIARQISKLVPPGVGGDWIATVDSGAPIPSIIS